VSLILTSSGIGLHRVESPRERERDCNRDSGSKDLRGVVGTQVGVAAGGGDESESESSLLDELDTWC
jgi:hypothetical protein